MRRWSTPEGLAFEDERTGDGRVFNPGSIQWEGGPWPLQWAREMGFGHDGAVLVGSIETVTRDGAAITGSGTLDNETDDGAEVERLLDAEDAAPLGVSVDLDDVEMEFVARGEGDAEAVILASAVAQVRVAFHDGRCIGLRAPGLRALAASAGLIAAAGDPANGDDEVVLWEEASDDLLMRVTRARFRGATLVTLPAFDRAAIALEAGDAEAAEPDAEPEGDEDAEPVAASAAGCACEGACGDCGTGAAVLPLVAAGAALPAEAFEDPHLTNLTPLTVQDGRVYGHIAGWSTCHTGSPAGACVTAPRSAANYAYFRTGVVETAAGDVAVGQVTIGGGHASLDLSYRGAAEHYDDVATAVADVAAGEDAYGVWVSGVLRPGVTDDQVAELRAASPSGDWRNVAGNLELVAVHAVNVPGFPVARVASGRPAALVASGGMAPRHEGPPIEAAFDLSLITSDAARVLGEQMGKAFAAELDRREAAPARRRLAAIAREVEQEKRQAAVSRLVGS